MSKRRGQGLGGYRVRSQDQDEGCEHKIWRSDTQETSREAFCSLVKGSRGREKVKKRGDMMEGARVLKCLLACLYCSVLHGSTKEQRQVD